jgi:hypothetical protein
MNGGKPSPGQAPNLEQDLEQGELELRELAKREEEEKIERGEALQSVLDQQQKKKPPDGPTISYLYNPANNPNNPYEKPSGGPTPPAPDQLVPPSGEPGDVITISGANFGIQAGSQNYVTLIGRGGGEWVSEGGPTTGANYQPTPLGLSATATLPGGIQTVQQPPPVTLVDYHTGSTESIGGTPPWSDTLLAITIPQESLALTEGTTQPSVTVTANGSTSNQSDIELSVGGDS